MRRTNTTRQKAGFTLIELLVVIAIIGLLIGLLLPAVMKFRSKGPEIKTRNEIGQIGNAIENFKSTYDVKYIPTCWWLSSDYAQLTPQQSPALNDSRQYFAKIWPKGFIANQPGKTMLPPNRPQPQQSQPLNVGMDGNQLLVFLLGGIPPSDSLFPTPFFQGNRSGFLNSPTNPFNYDPNTQQCVGGLSGEKVKGPFYDFDRRRIDTNGHYHDFWWEGNEQSTDPLILAESVYYYFSSKHGNDYQVFGTIYGNPNDPFRIAGMEVPGGYGANPYFGAVNPLIDADGKFWKFDGYQLISAGKDRRPGPGGPYSPGQAPYSFGPPGGGDDQANFGPGILGGVR